MIVMLSGIGVLGLVLATFADLLIEKTLKRRPLIKSFMEKHIIVCGWDKKLAIAVKELLTTHREIVVVAEVCDWHGHLCDRNAETGREVHGILCARARRKSV